MISRGVGFDNILARLAFCEALSSRLLKFLVAEHPDKAQEIFAALIVDTRAAVQADVDTLKAAAADPSKSGGDKVRAQRLSEKLAGGALEDVLKEIAELQS